MKPVVIVSVFLIIILCFTAYLNSLNAAFLWDDRYLVVENSFLRDFSHIKDIFTNLIGKGAGRYFSAYRPLQILTYLIDYRFWKLNPAGYHFTNIILQILASLLLLWFVYLLFGDWLLSFFTAVFFAIHPVHTGAITYISGRADPLAFVFIMISLIFYIKFIIKGELNAFVMMAASFLLAVFSRENSLILPALFFIVGTAQFAKQVPLSARQKRIWMVVTITSTISFVYLFLRAAVFQLGLPHIMHTSTFLERIPGFFIAITNYIRILILPINLHMEYGDALYKFTDPRAIFGIAITTALLTLAYKMRARRNMIFIAVAWFFIALLPVSNLYPIDNYMAEHWLYLPSIGFFIFLSNGLVQLYRTDRFRIFTVIFLIIIAVFYSLLTIKQNTYWKDDVSFYGWTLKHSPDSVRALNNLANAYADLGKGEEVVNLYERAIGLAPDFPTTYFNYGNYYKRVGQKQKAIELYEKAIQLNPDFTEAYNNLGSVYDSVGKYKEAIEAYKRAMAVNPGFAPSQNNLAIAYAHLRKSPALS